MILADTDVLIDYIRGVEPGAGAVERVLRDGRLATTVITAFELQAGARSPRERRKVNRLLTPLEIFPLGPEEAARAAELQRDLVTRGQAIGTADVLIAGIAHFRGTSLMTRNRRHFERIPGLRLEDLSTSGA